MTALSYNETIHYFHAINYVCLPDEKQLSVFYFPHTVTNRS